MSRYDDLLAAMADGLPKERAARYKLRCHPDVLQALKEASLADPGAYTPVPPHPGIYGAADVIVDDTMHPGCWEIRRDGTVVKAVLRGPDGTLYEITPPAAGRYWDAPLEFQA